MRTDPSHWGDDAFEEFVAKELEGLADRAIESGICIACLSDRLVYEVVAGLARSGLSEVEIFGIVQDALEDAEEDEGFEPVAEGRSDRMH